MPSTSDCGQWAVEEFLQRQLARGRRLDDLWFRCEQICRIGRGEPGDEKRIDHQPRAALVLEKQPTDLRALGVAQIG